MLPSDGPDGQLRGRQGKAGGVVADDAPLGLALGPAARAYRPVGPVADRELAAVGQPEGPVMVRALRPELMGVPLAVLEALGARGQRKGISDLVSMGESSGVGAGAPRVGCQWGRSWPAAPSTVTESAAWESPFQVGQAPVGVTRVLSEVLPGRLGRPVSPSFRQDAGVPYPLR